MFLPLTVLSLLSNQNVDFTATSLVLNHTQQCPSDEAICDEYKFHAIENCHCQSHNRVSGNCASSCTYIYSSNQWVQRANRYTANRKGWRARSLSVIRQQRVFPEKHLPMQWGEQSQEFGYIQGLIGEMRLHQNSNNDRH